MSQSAQAPSSPVSLRFTPDGQRVVLGQIELDVLDLGVLCGQDTTTRCPR